MFSHLRRQRPVNEVIEELSEFIEQNTDEFSEFLQDTTSVVGKHISHKFKVEDTREVKCYSGRVTQLQKHIRFPMRMKMNIASLMSYLSCLTKILRLSCNCYFLLYIAQCIDTHNHHVHFIYYTKTYSKSTVI